MSDDLRDAFGDDIFLEQDDEEAMLAEEGEGQNRTFLIGAAVLGGLLLCAIAVFAVYMLVLLPRQQEQAQAILLTNQAILANGGIAEETPVTEPEDVAEVTPTPEPATETPEPTATPTSVIPPTPTPDPDVDEENGEVEDADEATPTRTPLPTRTPRVTPTPPPETTPTATTAETTPDTGMGELLLVVAAGLLIGLMVMVRRLRHA